MGINCNIDRTVLPAPFIVVGVVTALLLFCALPPAQADVYEAMPATTFARHLDAGAYYAPPLPSPNFVDNEQRQVFQDKQLTLSDLVYFADAKTKEKPELCALRYDLKPWTDEEKKDVSAIVDRILHVAPGLLVRAASGGKLALCRTSVITTSHATGSIAGHNPAAVTCPCAIVLADRYFEVRSQFHGLVHELVHEVDSTGRVGFSKEWIDYINPTISKTRLELAFSPTYKMKDVVDRLRKNSLCPTPYSCENLQEALAEMTAAYVDDADFQADPSFFERFGRHLLLPDEGQQRIDMQFKLGSIAYRNGHYSESVDDFLPVLAAEPGLAVAHARLAACYEQMTDKNRALDEAKKGIALYTAAGAPWTEPEVHFAVGCLIACCYHSGAHDQAMKTLNQELAKVPFALDALYQRFYLEKKQSSYGDAVRDFYWSRFGTAYAGLLQDADADTDFTRQSLENEVEKFPAITLVVLRRAHFFEWLGDRQQDDNGRKNFYQLALADYQKALGLDCMAEVGLDCCNINLKLHNVREAEKYEAKALQEQPESLETKIMQIEILQALGKQNDAEQEFDQFWRRFGQASTP
jgi:tetratricopeptide (TPR) repeat protein